MQSSTFYLNVGEVSEQYRYIISEFNQMIILLYYELANQSGNHFRDKIAKNHQSLLKPSEPFSDPPLSTGIHSGEPPKLSHFDPVTDDAIRRS